MMTVDENDLVALESLQEKPLEEEQKAEGVALWVGAAILFGVAVGYFKGIDAGEAYFAGYILEQSLSVDNLFVFILIFNYFKCPRPLQNKVLTVGIASSAVLRLVMIILGSELVSQFEPVLLGFAAILLFSAYKLIVDSESDEEEDLS